MLWSPGQESNLDLTLRRRVHYPLCYREMVAGARNVARSLLAVLSRSIRAAPRVTPQWRLLNKQAGQLRAVLAPFGGAELAVIHTDCG